MTPFSATPLWDWIILLRKRAVGPPAVIACWASFPRPRLRKIPGLGGASVRTRMQFTGFLGRCSANGTSHGECLFPAEFLGFHRDIMQRSQLKKYSILLIFNALANPKVLFGLPAVLIIVSKSEHFDKQPS